MANQWFGDLVAVLTLLSRSTGPKTYSVAMQLYNVHSVWQVRKARCYIKYQNVVSNKGVVQKLRNCGKGGRSLQPIAVLRRGGPANDYGISLCMCM